MPDSTEFPIIRRPNGARPRPVLVSIPHYGTQTLPEIGPEHYSRPEHASFPLGYVDRFAAELYGDTHDSGATVIATPYSRLFVDVNRRRDDYSQADGAVTSPKGVVRTHGVHDVALFAKPLSVQSVERRLARYYDPYHASLGTLLDELSARHERVLLLDAHTAGRKGLKEHEVVVGTSRGRTARECVSEQIVEVFRAAGFRTERDLKGYSGGYIVRHYGKQRRRGIDAVQIEVNTGVLMTTSRREIFEAVKRGDPPAMCGDTARRLRRCVQTVIGQFRP